jgi:5-carboxymethyl-2-hydroxymuconic-semialdehyde dehydrogenase
VIEHLIGGDKVGSRETFETLNPATGEVIDEVAAAGEAEVAAAVDAARRAFPAWAA